MRRVGFSETFLATTFPPVDAVETLKLVETFPPLPSSERRAECTSKEFA